MLSSEPGTLIRNGRPPYRNNVDRRASAREPTEYTSHVRIMYRVDICFIFVVFGEEKVPQVGVECFRTNTKLIHQPTQHHNVNFVTNIVNMNCQRSSWTQIVSTIMLVQKFFFRSETVYPNLGHLLLTKNNENKANIDAVHNMDLGGIFSRLRCRGTSIHLYFSVDHS